MTSGHPGGHLLHRCWGNAQVILEAAVPSFWQVLDLDLTFKQADLNLQAQHNMQVISGFIGLHTDQRRLNFVDRFVICVHIYIAKLGGEMLLEFGVVPLCEGLRASHQILPQAGLRFVDRQ